MLYVHLKHPSQPSEGYVQFAAGLKAVLEISVEQQRKGSPFQPECLDKANFTVIRRVCSGKSEHTGEMESAFGFYSAEVMFVSPCPSWLCSQYLIQLAPLKRTDAQEVKEAGQRLVTAPRKERLSSGPVSEQTFLVDGEG